MKKYLFFALILVASNLKAQSQESKPSVFNDNTLEIQERISIKNVVDTFSILADQKDTQKQVFLFTEDATVESKVQGQPGMVIKGRKQIGDVFGAFLKNFEVVYHINGQQTIVFKDQNNAHGISYCLVVLIGNENGEKMKTTMGVYYQDDFVKKDNQWLIDKRVSTFVWREKSTYTGN